MNNDSKLMVKMAKEILPILLFAICLVAAAYVAPIFNYQVLQIHITPNGNIDYTKFDNETLSLFAKSYRQSSGVGGNYDIYVDGADNNNLNWRFTQVGSGYYYVIDSIPDNCVLVESVQNFTQIINTTKACMVND
jgi:hypothetical protein